MSRLDRTYFEQDTNFVARDLLGRHLVVEGGDGKTIGRIVETEAYTGWEDLASHGRAGKTPRNLPMFDKPGTCYVYLAYGVHWLLNIVAKPPDVDYPAAVLIRAVEPLEGLDLMAQRRAGRKQKDWTNGPGKLTVAFGIDKSLNHTDIIHMDSKLYVTQGEGIPDVKVQTGPRIGINVEEPWQSIAWRYWISDNQYVSK